jgi:hypothetical protein
MSKLLIARISAITSLAIFFGLVHSPKFWAECVERAQRKLDDSIKFYEELWAGESWPYNYEPQEYDVLWEAWDELHTRFGLRYADKWEVIEFLESIYFRL